VKVSRLEIGIVILGVLQLGVVSQLPGRGHRRVCRVPFHPRRRLAEQAPVADFLDVARFERDLDREAVFQFVQLSEVECGLGIVLGQRLLRGGNDPDLAVAQVLEVLGQAVEIEDQVVREATYWPTSSTMKTM
jgi:hypothetical protein